MRRLEVKKQESGAMAGAGEKRAADGQPVADASDILKITPLGAGNEVGRSCIMIEYKKKTIMVRQLGGTL